MNLRRTLKLVHLTSTAWFVLSSLYILVWALLQEEQSWWVIVSLSGYSALLVLLLISLYLFAIFRGIARSQKIRIEHPLTTSTCYLVFYCVGPFLGALAGALGGIGISKVSDHVLLIAIGSFWVTLLVWIIVDPVTGLVELLLPSSQSHRRKRLVLAKAAREKQRLAKLSSLVELEAQEKQEQVLWSEILQPYADRLAALAVRGEAAGEQGETEAVDMGLKAWQLGGTNCMRLLHSMAIDICRERHQDANIIDYIAIWWDGIGNWRSHWLEGESEPMAEKGGILCVM